MADVTISNRWIQIRVDESSDRATLYASAETGGRSATATRELELPRQLINDLRAVIAEHASEVDQTAMAHLFQAIQIDEGAQPPDGVKAIKIDASLGGSGATAAKKKES